MMKEVIELSEIYAIEGQKKYSEKVSQVQHAVQVAKLAEKAGAGDAQIAACLLHDIGHLIFNENLALKGQDDVHEVHGAIILSQFFGPDVFEPVRLHVEAKRYLCSIDSDYYDSLSQASKDSLNLQGGRYTEDKQTSAFENNAYFKEAVQLRQFDDYGKNPENVNENFDQYLPLLNDLYLFKP